MATRETFTSEIGVFVPEVAFLQLSRVPDFIARGSWRGAKSAERYDRRRSS